MFFQQLSATSEIVGAEGGDDLLVVIPDVDPVLIAHEAG